MRPVTHCTISGSGGGGGGIHTAAKFTDTSACEETKIGADLLVADRWNPTPFIHVARHVAVRNLQKEVKYQMSPVQLVLITCTAAFFLVHADVPPASVSVSPVVYFSSHRRRIRVKPQLLHVCSRFLCLLCCAFHHVAVAFKAWCIYAKSLQIITSKSCYGDRTYLLTFCSRYLDATCCLLASLQYINHFIRFGASIDGRIWLASARCLHINDLSGGIRVITGIHVEFELLFDCMRKARAKNCDL